MIEDFRKRSARDGVRVFRAPGRVNLIGEHTDYNLGFVLPVALDLATLRRRRASSDGKLASIPNSSRKCASGRRREHSRSSQPAHDWTDYAIGVAQELDPRRLPDRAGEPADPQHRAGRRGLSSSAALEVSSALALLDGRAFDPLELAKLCQRAENAVSSACPAASWTSTSRFSAREHAAVEIDCRSLEHRYVRLPDGIEFIAVNTMVKHALAGSAYRERVQECADAVELHQAAVPRGESLRDVSRRNSSRQVDIAAAGGRAARAARGDRRRRAWSSSWMPPSAATCTRMGKLFVDSHRSLQHDYEVSCEELDFLVDTALAIEGVYGSRMTGGGFGGCTVTMLRPDAAGRFRDGLCGRTRRNSILRRRFTSAGPHRARARSRTSQRSRPHQQRP